MNPDHRNDARKRTASVRQEMPIVLEISCSQHDQIATAAYYLAEQRGFVAGNDLDDWLRAEAIVSQAR